MKGGKLKNIEAKTDMINVKEKKTERTEKIGKGQTAPKRKKTATVERIAQAIGSKRFLAIVLCCCAWAVFHAVNMYAVYSDLLKRVRDALPIIPERKCSDLRS